jgi:hypothetical protein
MLVQQHLQLGHQAAQFWPGPTLRHRLLERTRGGGLGRDGLDIEHAVAARQPTVLRRRHQLHSGGAQMGADRRLQLRELSACNTSRAVQQHGCQPIEPRDEMHRLQMQPETARGLAAVAGARDRCTRQLSVVVDAERIEQRDLPPTHSVARRRQRADRAAPAESRQVWPARAAFGDRLTPCRRDLRSDQRESLGHSRYRKT